jgi:hypothetical protein
MYETGASVGLSPEDVEEFEDELWEQYQLAVARDSSTPAWTTFKEVAYDDLDAWDKAARFEFEDDEFTKKTPFNAG